MVETTDISKVDYVPVMILAFKEVAEKAWNASKGNTRAVELARIVFPDKDDEFLNFALWEKTGYPIFFNRDGSLTAKDILLRQLLNFKASIKPTPPSPEE